MPAYVFPGRFPSTRPRRLRSAPWIRDLVAETALRPQDLVLNLILRDETAAAGPIPAMPGIGRHTVDEVVTRAEIAWEAGIKALALFPFTGPDSRSPGG